MLAIMLQTYGGLNLLLCPMADTTQGVQLHAQPQLVLYIKMYI